MVVDKLANEYSQKKRILDQICKLLKLDYDSSEFTKNITGQDEVKNLPEVLVVCNEKLDRVIANLKFALKVDVPENRLQWSIDFLNLDQEVERLLKDAGYKTIEEVGWATDLMNIEGMTKAKNDHITIKIWEYKNEQ